MTQPLKVGIVGTGSMAATMVQAMQGLPEVRPVAVLSKGKMRADAFADAFDIKGAFDDREAFFAESGCEIVYIANSNVDHAEMAQAAIAAQLHVMVEKPLSLTPQDTQSIYSNAEAKGLMVAENLWTLALPAYRALKKQVFSGTFGMPRHLSFDFSIPVEPVDYPGLFAPVGGGVLFDRAVYGLATACDLLGDVSQLDANVITNGAGIDTSAVLQLRHGEAVSSTVTVALDHAGRNDMCLSLEGGVLTLKSGLAAESLGIDQQSRLSRKGDPLDFAKQTNLKQRLKGNKTLRRLKSRFFQGTTAFHSYGSNSYHPILREVSETLRAGLTEIPSVPRELSYQVARLVAEAKAGHVHIS